jgi:hypothetical protein
MMFISSSKSIVAEVQNTPVCAYGRAGKSFCLMKILGKLIKIDWSSVWEKKFWIIFVETNILDEATCNKWTIERRLDCFSFRNCTHSWVFSLCHVLLITDICFLLPSPYYSFLCMFNMGYYFNRMSISLPQRIEIFSMYIKLHSVYFPLSFPVFSRHFIKKNEST